MVRFNFVGLIVCVLVDGYVINFRFRFGDYVIVGVMKVVVFDVVSFWIIGYFEEMKI